jgi:hypothetical protein
MIGYQYFSRNKKLTMYLYHLKHPVYLTLIFQSHPCRQDLLLPFDHYLAIDWESLPGSIFLDRMRSQIKVTLTSIASACTPLLISISRSP